MRTAASVLKFFTHLQLCKLYAHSIIKDNPNTIFAKIFKHIMPKLDWIYNAVITHNLVYQHIPQTIDLIREQWQSDVVLELGLNEKITLLSEQQKELLEPVLDCILQGETFEVVTNK